jgi:tRNA dimethylallyltransferase
VLSKANRIIAVVGPTCTGKSDLALLLASQFDGEIVNADSMQVYQHFDIGTAKPDSKALSLVPHHLIDVVSPSHEFNAALFKELATNALADIHSRGNLPVVVGGTGLYVKALIYSLFKVPRDDDLRQRIQEEYIGDPLASYEKLRSIDPEYAKKISHRDRVRVVRALEVFTLTGTSMSGWEKRHGFREAKYRALKVGLVRDREELYSRINRRVDAMLEKGWVDEVRSLLSLGYDVKLKPFSSIGYREILRYLNHSIDYEDMVKEIKMHTRNYAKRQFTWFSKEQDIAWFSYPEEVEDIRERVRGFLAE